MSKKTRATPRRATRTRPTRTRQKVPRPPTGSPLDLGFQRVKSTYTPEEISQLFGLSHRVIRRWTSEGVIQTVETTEDGEPVYDFRALTQFRRVREMRAAGMTTAQIDAVLRGQRNLFEAEQGRLISLPLKLSPFEQALILQDKCDPGAADLYRRAIRAGENVADAYCNLGILEFEAGEISKAANCFGLSLKSDPRHFESHFNLANLYFDSGDLSLARLHYEVAIEIEPRFSHLHFNVALAYALQGNLELALASLRRFKELDSWDERGDADDLLAKLERLMNQQPH
jgi:tetratricopeptide (TPR) repeat protein